MSPRAGTEIVESGRELPHRLYPHRAVRPCEHLAEYWLCEKENVNG